MNRQLAWRPRRRLNETNPQRLSSACTEVALYDSDLYYELCN